MTENERREREAFEGLSAKLWCDLRTDEERSAWLLLGRGHETGVVAQALQNDLAMAYHRLALLSASPAVPVAQDERAEALQALVEALESFPGFAVDIGDERDTFVRKGKVALSLGRAALSAATPPAPQEPIEDQCPHCNPNRFCTRKECNESAATQPAAVPMSQKTQDGHSASRSGEAPTVPAAWTTYAHIHAIGFGKSGLFVKEPGGPFCVPVFFGEAQHINEGFNDNV